MLILAIIVAGMFVGWIAQLVLGADSRSVDWGMALIAGVAGSFVGGLLASLIAGDGLDIRPSGFGPDTPGDAAARFDRLHLASRWLFGGILVGVTTLGIAHAAREDAPERRLDRAGSHKNRT